MRRSVFNNSDIVLPPAFVAEWIANIGVNPLGVSGDWYKCQLHCHTTNSDGDASPTAVVTSYRDFGYDAISIHDHNVVTADPGVSGITFIPGVENSPRQHIGVLDPTNWTLETYIYDSLARWEREGLVARINHPLNGVGADTALRYMVNCPSRFQLEIWNGYDNADWGYEALWDQILSRGRLVYGQACDDCHIYPTNQNRAWVMVKAASASKADILAAIAAGHFYASNGNDIAVSLAGSTITASSVASSNFDFIGLDGAILKTENGVTSSSYTFTGAERYVRVRSKLASDVTKIAWSQPIVVS